MSEPKWDETEEAVPKFEDTTEPTWEETAEVAEPSELSSGELVKSVGGAVAGGVIGEGVRRKSSQILDPIAEKLAYTAAGGHDTPSGKKLVESIANKTPGKNFGILDMLKTTPDQVKEILTDTTDAYDHGVTPNGVGRQILDEKLLGPLGIGTNKGNAERSATNLRKKSIPTNQMLNSIEDYPIHQSGVFERMKQLVGYDKLNETVPDQAAIKMKLDKLNDTSFGDIETPMIAERAKRDLQRGVDFADPEKSVKETINAAQSTARKEAVENAVENMLGPEKLEEFKRLKSQAGNAGVAKDVLEETLKKGQRSPNPFFSITGAIGDLLGKKLPGAGASLVDTASKIAKSPAGKLIPGVGALVGGTVGALAVDEQTDSTDFIPGLDQATPAGSSLDDKSIQTEVKALQNYEQSTGNKINPEVAQKILNTPTKFEVPEMTKPEMLDTPSISDQARSSMEQRFQNVDKFIKQTKENNDVLRAGNTLKQATPEQLMELSQSFKDIKGADNFVAPLENAAQATTEEEKRARLFGLYQQPAFRQLLNKGSKS